MDRVLRHEMDARGSGVWSTDATWLEARNAFFSPSRARLLATGFEARTGPGFEARMLRALKHQKSGPWSTERPGFEAQDTPSGPCFEAREGEVNMRCKIRTSRATSVLETLKTQQQGSRY